jgi:hypothetical protein
VHRYVFFASKISLNQEINALCGLRAFESWVSVIVLLFAIKSNILSIVPLFVPPAPLFIPLSSGFVPFLLSIVPLGGDVKSMPL